MYVDIVSEKGLFQDFLIVGANASAFIVESKITERIGCFAKTHNASATKAKIKNIVSEKVICFSPLNKLKPNIKNTVRLMARVIREPTPAPALNCSANINAVANPKVNHVYA